MVVIGNISLDGSVQIDDLQAWCAYEFRFKVLRNCMLGAHVMDSVQ